MKELRLTSPGVLLIVAVVLAGGIYLLDLFYLQPMAKDQQAAAIREQAARTEQAIRLAMRTQQSSLTQMCANWAQTSEVSQLFSKPADSLALAALSKRAFSSWDVDCAWLTDKQGRVIQAWHAAADTTVKTADLDRMVRELNGSGPHAAEGTCELAGQVVFFARQKIAPGDSSSEGCLWLARRLDTKIQEKLAAATGTSLTFIRLQTLPKVGDTLDSGSICFWQDGREKRNLSLAWLEHDPSGKALGCFQASVPIPQIFRQSLAARRSVLIVLSLSMGLVLLIIIGMHILVTGPVVRLLRRLQQVESGSVAAKNLTRDLHGEPLVLARRLESAFEKLAHLSKTDQLSGLANRRHFEEVLGCFYIQSRRYNRPLSLMIIDIDFFKAVNDTAGHQAGDDLIKLMAKDIESSCRKADLPARWGGDEFAVLMPETSCNDAELVAHRIRQQVSERILNFKGTTAKVTLSIGITDLNSGEIDSPGAMVSLADRALYSAKEMGRDRVIQAHDLDGLTWPGSTENNGKVDVLCRKLAGLDSQIKDLFVFAVEEVVEILEQRDPHMAMHARKVQHCSVLIAKEMGLPPRVIKRLEIAAMLHDIGMIAMPDSLLLCPDQLNEQQIQVLRRHPLLSVRIMEGMEFLEQEIPAVRYHHERFDGKGYPEGLAGAQIPLTARVLAVADGFVAITSPRTFRGARAPEDAIREIQEAAGTQFDPAVVEAFVAVAQRLGDKLMDVPALPRTSPAEIMEQA